MPADAFTRPSQQGLSLLDAVHVDARLHRDAIAGGMLHGRLSLAVEINEQAGLHLGIIGLGCAGPRASHAQARRARCH